MQILDGHIHIRAGRTDPKKLMEWFQQAGVEGAVLLSRPPKAFLGIPGLALDETPDQRLDNLMRWAEASPSFFPYFWIDPREDDVHEQIDRAAQRGVLAFKVICSHYHPGDRRALEVFSYIAAKGLPILFHSGILWDGEPSSRFNRPAEFEALLEVKRLKFCLAHIGWPWCDEMIAVYGKFLNATLKHPEAGEMFIDLTPGTPPIYRKEVLTRLLTVGYAVEDNLIFGSDCTADEYNVKWTKEWIDRDNEIYRSLGIPQSTMEKIYGRNLKRFLGFVDGQAKKKVPMPGQS